METVGVVVGRFQVSALTPGHYSLLHHVARLSQRLVVVLGKRPYPDVRNPLTYELRRDMLTASVRSIYQVLPLTDKPGDDKAWSASLDDLLFKTWPGSNITLYGGRDCFLSHYKGVFKTDYVETCESVTGTDHRGQITPAESAQFRAGVIWAVKTYFPTLVVAPKGWAEPNSSGFVYELVGGKIEIRYVGKREPKTWEDKKV